MGTAAHALLAVALAAAPARADTCTGVTRAGSRYTICFDLGNRLSLTAGSDGVGGAISIRHVIKFEDEPDLEWKMEHVLGEATHALLADGFRGALYRGRYLRHARDGHIVIPLGTPKKVFLPFDVGAEVEAGTVTWRPGEATTEVGVVRAAALIDVSRSRTFRTRVAFGPVAHWRVDLERDVRAVVDHAVAPFSLAMFNLHLESYDGLSLLDVRVEGGSAWHPRGGGWRTEARAEATLERIVLAVNDRPVALVVGVRHDTATDETIARVGARVVIVGARDPRVGLLDHR
ncbi:MAG: hypothetical protein KF773_22925 [Deltaproteobacteria bacterium]|nr:hypothetical protein [Deltaproteobacteria bacterium]